MVSVDHDTTPLVRSAGDARGQILIMTAVSMFLLLGVAALSIDASFLYSRRNRLHAAADGGAASAALELLRGNTSHSNLVAFAQAEVNAQLSGMGITPVVECSTTATGTFSTSCGSASKFV